VGVSNLIGGETAQQITGSSGEFTIRPEKDSPAGAGTTDRRQRVLDRRHESAKSFILARIHAIKSIWPAG